MRRDILANEKEAKEARKKRRVNSFGVDHPNVVDSRCLPIQLFEITKTSRWVTEEMRLQFLDEIERIEANIVVREKEKTED